MSRMRAYPRWRGEHWRCEYTVPLSAGLPPLARGAPRIEVKDRLIVGPTPAGAGSTIRTRRAMAMSRAYPRWRGEHMWAAFRMTDVVGLPPLARGARMLTQRSREIPGLPPLARGAQGLIPAGADRAGPTPAGAGSTKNSRRSKAVDEAYPRWRGEHTSGPRVSQSASGLPPLARGAPAGDDEQQGHSRPTPAGAGSTLTLESPVLVVWAYPRWRGEHLNVTATTWAARWPTPAGAGSTEPVA